MPVHRWLRYSAGFSARWVEQVIREELQAGEVSLFDPFAGSGTTLIAAETVGVPCWGVEAHPFVARICAAKLAWRTSPEDFRAKVMELRKIAAKISGSTADYPALIHKCYDDAALAELELLRRAYEKVADESAATALAWLCLVSILRKTSHAGTAQWQYVLPKKNKRNVPSVEAAFEESWRMMYGDMQRGQNLPGPRAQFALADARDCDVVPTNFANLVITSPPYPNNYDYADATRLEMSFFREVRGWGDLHETVRKHLVCSCTQHVPERSVDLDAILSRDAVRPIQNELTQVCGELGEVRKSKGGKKTYHLMVASYFHDLALVWHSLRRICRPGAKVCMVIGDSAPYGVYVPVIPWLGALAIAAGFESFSFERTRARNIKWKNRKHRVPLQEGRLWVKG